MIFLPYLNPNMIQVIHSIVLQNFKALFATYQWWPLYLALYILLLNWNKLHQHTTWTGHYLTIYTYWHTPTRGHIGTVIRGAPIYSLLCYYHVFGIPTAARMIPFVRFLDRVGKVFIVNILHPLHLLQRQSRRSVHCQCPYCLTHTL